MSKGDFLHVVAAAVVNSSGQVLIAKRPGHLHQGGKWEFPGGKVEPGERAQDALRRELSEELGISAERFEPLIQVGHRYPDKAVFLDVWKVTHHLGHAEGRQGQPLAWVAPRDLPRYTFPAANRPIIKALVLPDVYLITPEPGHAPRALLDGLETTLRGGATLVQLRAPSLDARNYCDLARAALERCRAHGARLLINGEPEWAVRLDTDGVHLNSARLKATLRRPLPRGYLVAASCHDREEIAHAGSIDADFAVLSPVRRTSSHPRGRPLGWRAFHHLCAEAALPIYALGGMKATDVARAKRHGGQGIAAIRALWAG